MIETFILFLITLGGCIAFAKVVEGPFIAAIEKAREEKENQNVRT